MATKEVGSLRTRLSWDDNGADKSLQGFRSDLSGLNTEMKVATSKGKEYANSLKGLREQSDILTRKFKTQEQQVSELRKRYDESVKAKGADDKQTRNLLKSYNNAVAAMNKTEQQLDNVTSAIKEQTNPWKKLADNAEQTGDRIKRVGDGLSSFGQTLSTSVTAPIIGLGTLAVESTRELREDMARLETNAKLAGTGVDVMEKSMRNLNAITGETDSNVEALSNLMATGMVDNQLLQAVDALSGAVIKFPDTLKIEGLADGLQETLATGKAIGPFAELLERMGVDLETFDEGLAKASESGDSLNYVLDELNKLDLSKVNKEFRETNKELVDGRNAQYDFMDAMSELGKKLEPIATRITESVTDIIEKFNELEPEVQDNILKFAGLAAAVGPASMALGGAINTVGNLAKGVGGLAGLLGKSGGAGLLGRIGLMGVAGGPVGLAIAGVGTLGLGIYALTKASQENLDETLKSIQTRKEEVESVDELIASFEGLQRKNRLSTDEVLRYMDIMDELKGAKSEEAIKKLTDEQGNLLEKSGLTNDEMEDFLGLNDKIVEKSPSTSKAISEQGNAYAAVLDELKELNETERQRVTDKTYDALTSEMDKQERNLNKQKELQAEIKNLESDRTTQNEGILEYSQKIKDQDLLIAGLKEDINNASWEEVKSLESKLVSAQTEKLLLIDGRKEHEKIVEKIDKQIEKKEKSLAETMKELGAFDDLKDEYEQMVLYQAGLTSEKGKGVQKLHEEEQAIRDSRNELKEMLKNQQIGTAEYQAQNSKLDTQQSKIDTAKRKLEEMNTVAGRTVYKDVKTKVAPSIQSINRDLASGVYKTVNIGTVLDGNYRRLSSPAYKTLNITTSGGGHYVDPGYAEGTNYHPGGNFIAGEEGYELGRLGDRWEMLNFGRYNRPAGYEVFTHGESKKILGALNKLPAYASGVSSTGEADRVVNRLNTQQQPDLNDSNNQPFIIQLVTPNKRILAEMVVDDVTELQSRKIYRKRQGT